MKVFLNDLSGTAADSSFHVFEGTEIDVVMSECIDVRQVMLDYAFQKTEELQAFHSNSSSNYTPDNLVCLTTGEFR